MLPKFTPLINSLPLVHQGKIRDLYELDNEHLLFVTSDRVSAFDMVFPTPINEKGSLLTSISNFWFKKTDSIIKNHIIHEYDYRPLVNDTEYQEVKDKAVVVKKCTPLPYEFIVRQYLLGSAFDEYKATGYIDDIKLPDNLFKGCKLNTLLFTVTTKETQGHDKPSSFKELETQLGTFLAQEIRSKTLSLFSFMADIANDKKLVLVDTKFELGFDGTDLILIDEVGTPDCSRYWFIEDKEGYVHRIPSHLDKQIFRNYLIDIGWDYKSPILIPNHIQKIIRYRYKTVRNMLLDIPEIPNYALDPNV